MTPTPSHCQTLTILINIVQDEDETLSEYFTRYTKMALGIDGMKDSEVIVVLRCGLKANLYAAFLIQCPMKTLAEAMTHTQEVVQSKSSMLADGTR